MCKCYLLLHPWLGGAASPPGPPSSLTIVSPSKTRSPSCFSRLHQAADITAAEDALAFCRCRPWLSSLPAAAAPCEPGCRSCVAGSGSAPARSQSCPKTCLEKLRPASPLWRWGTRRPWDRGPTGGCGAAWALGAGAAPASLPASAARVWAGAGASAGGASALRHPGFLTSPSPGPVSSFAWPAMAAIPRRSKGKLLPCGEAVQRRVHSPGPPRALPRNKGVTQSQGTLPPHASCFGSWRRLRQHRRTRRNLQRALGIRRLL